MPVRAAAMIAVLSTALLHTVPARAQDAAAVPRTEREIRTALATQHSFAFDKAPLRAAFEDIAQKSGVEVTLDWKAFEGGGVPTVTWSFRRCSAERALRWVTRLSDLDWRIVDGAVLVSTPRNLQGPMVRKTYDIRDLEKLPQDRPGPQLGFFPPDAPPPAEVVMFPQSFADVIMNRVMPSSWSPELGTSVEERDGILIASNHEDVHEKIRSLLRAFRRLRRRPVRVDVVALAAPHVRRFVSASRGRDGRPVDLDEALRHVPDHAALAFAEVATFDGLLAHTVSGTKRQYVASKMLDWPTPYDANHDDTDWEVIREPEMPKALVVKVPSRPQVPRVEGRVVPVIDALLDGAMFEVQPWLLAGADAAELSVRAVLSHPHALPRRNETAADAIETPTVDYSRLHTTMRVARNAFSTAGALVVRTKGADVPVEVLVRAVWERVAAPPIPEPEPDPEVLAIREALEAKSAFQYPDTRISEVIADIRSKCSVEIVLEPRALAIQGNVPITWSSRGCSIAHALRWVARQADLSHTIVDGAVFVFTRYGQRLDPVQRVYDVRGIPAPHPDRWGPAKGFRPPGIDVTESPDDWTLESIAEMIQARVHPGEWAAELGTSIELRDGLLIVVQRPKVHRGVRELLDAMARTRRSGVTVEILAVPADRAGPLLVADAAAVPALVARIPADDLIVRARIATLDGVAAHVVAGTKRHYVCSKALRWPEPEESEYRRSWVDHRVIEEEGAPKVMLVEVPSRPSAPEVRGEVIPVADALLDGTYVGAEPRLDEGGERVRLGLRVVVSHPRLVGAGNAGGTDSIETPMTEYARLETNVELALGAFGVAGRLTVRRGIEDVPVVVMARVTSDGD